jgi:hypothetical protein
LRREFKITAIKERIEFCESERRQLISMVTRSPVNLAWISERMGSIEKELRFLYHDLKVEEKGSEEWN